MAVELDNNLIWLHNLLKRTDLEDEKHLVLGLEDHSLKAWAIQNPMVEAAVMHMRAWQVAGIHKRAW